MDEPAWRYPALDDRDAHHFASDLFARLHDISIHDRVENTGETVLAFCPRSRKQPSIEGTLRLAADGTLLEAEWTLRTPRPVHLVGGHVIFSRWRSHGDQLPHLLPERAVWWAENPRFPNRYSHRYTIYTSWRIGSDGSVPSLNGSGHPDEDEGVRSTRSW